MSIADITLSLIIFIFQKIILPVLPTNFPLLDLETFSGILNGSMKHNLTYAFAGINQLFNLELLFIVLGSVIAGELLFWLVRAGLFVVKLVRG